MQNSMGQSHVFEVYCGSWTWGPSRAQQNRTFLQAPKDIIAVLDKNSDKVALINDILFVNWLEHRKIFDFDQSFSHISDET